MNDKIYEIGRQMYAEDASMTDVANYIADSLSLGRTQSMEHAKKVWATYSSDPYVPINQRTKTNQQVTPTETVSEKFTQTSHNDAVAESKGSRIKTLEELLSACKVDLDVWKVDRFTCNKWEVGAKDDLGDMNVTPLFQVKANLSKKLDTNTATIIKDLKSDLINNSPKNIITYPSSEINGALLEVCLFDLHLGKYGKSSEVGTDYGLEEARRVFLQAINDILGIAKRQCKISQIVFPIGNDFLNIDNIHKTTTAGTPQDCEGSFSEIFRKGRELLIEGINILQEVAPVKVISVKGNHDCYDDSTEVLTNNGFKNHYELTNDDKIATINNNFEIEYQEFSNYFCKSYQGKMFHVKNRYCDLLVTPNHKVFSRRPAEDSYSLKEIESVDFNEPLYFRATSNPVKSDFPIEDAWYKLFAWINSDGSIKDININPYYEIFQVEDKAHLIKSVLDELNIKYNLHKRERTINSIQGVKLKKTTNIHCIFGLSKKNLTEEQYKIITENLIDKYTIPSCVFESSPRQIKLYLESFIDGDGTRKENLDNWATIYGIKPMLDQIQDLVFRSGGYSRINRYKENQWRLYYQKSKQNTRVNSKHVSKIDYTGNIWCLSVPNKKFITRRNGVTNIQGNSSATFHLGDALECWFHNSDRVEVDNNAKSRKYFSYGKNLIIYTHGDKEKPANLPIIAATEEPKLWADATYREVRMGHLHHEIVKEHNGVKIRWVPSLSGNDAYHYDRGYVGNIRTAQGFLFDIEDGLQSVIYSKPVK